MKKLICLLFVFIITVPFVIAGGGADRTPRGKITIYTSMYENVIENVNNQLQRRFPRCNVEFVYGGTGRIKNMISVEQSTGRLGCDILMVAEPAYTLELKEMGLLHSYMSREAVNLAFEFDREGYWYPVRINNMVLAFNPLRTPKNTIPNSFYDFAHDSRVRGTISMRNPAVSGTSLATLTALRDKYGYEYFTALGRQQLRIEYGTVGALGRLESGEYKVIMILEESILQKREQENSSLEIIYPTDGTVMIPSTIMIVNNRWSKNRNTRAAEVITDWFLSEEGQNAIVAGWMHSVRIDHPRIPNGSRPISEIRANSIQVDLEENYRQRDEVLSRFEGRN